MSTRSSPLVTSGGSAAPPPRRWPRPMVAIFVPRRIRPAPAAAAATDDDAAAVGHR
jgi:hypothetical protein